MLLQRLSMLYIPDFFSQLLYGPCESAQSVAGHSETATRACSCGFVAKPRILQHLILNEVNNNNNNNGLKRGRNRTPEGTLLLLRQSGVRPFAGAPFETSEERADSSRF